MNLCKMAQIEGVLLDLLVKEDQNESFLVGVDVTGLAALLRGHDFQSILSSKKAENFKQQMKTSSTFDEFQVNISDVYDKSDLDQRWEVLAIGVASLQLFVEVNWTGLEAVTDWPEAGFAAKNLTLDGEEICPVVQNLGLFVLAKAILTLKTTEDGVMTSTASKWWQFRSLWIHQQLLEEKSEVIFKEAKSLLSNLDIAQDKSKHVQIHFWLEVATFWLSYFDINAIRDAVIKAGDLAGLKVKETGILGRRTKFQEKEVAQLTLDIHNLNPTTTLDQVHS
jgi:hypothetical protein